MSMPHDQQRHQPQTVAARNGDADGDLQVGDTTRCSIPDLPEMALNERLNKYKLQQGRCQTTLSGIAASQTSIPRSNISPRVQPINDDTEKLRRIGLVRMSSVGAQLNLVFELLYMTRQALTAEQINVATYVHVHGNKVVFDCLRNNQKVHFDGIRFSYKSKYDLKGRDQLLSLIGEFPGVLPVVDVKDAYLAVLGDLKVGNVLLLLYLKSDMFKAVSTCSNAHLPELFMDLKL
uniref:TFIIE beta domain-containing protein n=1 Tax=Leersia perrieri TaxID=77586 RepID=A0A0D9VQ59_9ORYZ